MTDCEDSLRPRCLHRKICRCTHDESLCGSWRISRLGSSGPNRCDEVDALTVGRLLAGAGNVDVVGVVKVSITSAAVIVPAKGSRHRWTRLVAARFHEALHNGHARRTFFIGRICNPQCYSFLNHM